MSGSPLEVALAALFPADVRLAVGAIDTVPRFAHPEEAACVARAVPKRQREFAAGRRLAHDLLDGLGAPAAPLLPGPRRGPLWPAGFVGTISHGPEWCVVAVARGGDRRALGVDHEPAGPLPGDVWNSVLLPVERERLALLPEGERGVTARLLFSAKECLYKAIADQLGEVIDFLEVEVRLDGGGDGPEQPDRFTCRLVDEARARSVRGVLEGRALRRPEGLFTAMALAVGD